MRDLKKRTPRKMGDKLENMLNRIGLIHRSQKLQKGKRGWLYLDLEDSLKGLFNWEYCVELSGPKLEVELHGGESNQDLLFSFGLVFLKIYINFCGVFKSDKEGISRRYGFNFFMDQFQILWGSAEPMGYVKKQGFSKMWPIPFKTWNFKGHWILRKDGLWVKGEHIPKLGDRSWYPGWDEKNQSFLIPPDDRWYEIYEYTYKLKSGVVQERKAFCHVEKRLWTRKWLPFQKMVKKSLNFYFNGEVGERTGSWKGGAISSSIKMFNNETEEQAFRRMERERKFK